MQSQSFHHMVRFGLWPRLPLTQVGFTFLLFLGWGWLGVPQIRAQVTTATLLGTVSDPTGAAVPGATVTATNESTGRTSTVTTGADGSYLLPLLPITGAYTVEVEAQNFQKPVQKGIVLRLNENVRVDFFLKLGSVTETVEVTGLPPQVDTRSSSLGEVIENRRVTELPLNGRNPIQLASLVAGVTTISAPTVYTLRGGNQVSVNGARTNGNDFLLDGAHYEGAYFNNGPNYPAPDALQEFKLITNTFSAEFGRNAGSVFNAVPKSGTNGIHAGGWEFLRNDALNAKNYFLNAPGAKKATLRQNQFGFTVGGPAIKNKWFWFGSYQGLRIRQETLRTTTPPTAAERAGFFTRPLNDPDTGLPIAPDGQGRYFIDPSRFEPITVNAMNQVVPLPGPDGTLTQLGSTPSDNKQFLIRSDVNIKSSNVLNATFFQDRTNREDPFFTSNLLGWSGLTAPNVSWVATLTDTQTFRPTLLNQFRISYHRMKDFFNATDKQIPLNERGSISYRPDALNNPENPSFNVAGRFSLSTIGLFDLYEDTRSQQIADTVTWIHGKHSFKTGVEVNRVSALIHAWFLNEGNYTFNGQITGDSVADFLVGRPAQYQRQTFAGDDVFAWEFAGFFQDDWRISRRLTLNLGLRYFVQTPYVVNCCPLKDSGGAFRPGQQSTRYKTAPAGLVYPGDAGIPRGTYPTDTNNWEPRIGLAWDPLGDGKTSVRVSYGVFHDLVVPDTVAQGLSNQPFTYREIFNAPPGGVRDTYQGFPNPWPYTAYKDPNPAFVLPVFVSSTDAHFHNPAVQGWAFDIQRQLIENFMVEAAYTGKLGRGLEETVQGNPAVYIPGTDPATGQPFSTLANVDARRVYAPTFAFIRDSRAIGELSFHSLQLTTRYRTRHDLSFSTAYTWSKALDTVSTFSVGGAFPQDPFCPVKCNKGPSDFDLRHVFAASWVYDVPTPFRGQTGFGGALARHVLGGWEISGITRLTSGSHFSCASGVNNSLSGDFGDRCDVAGDWQAISNSRPRSERILKWFNTDAFTVNALGRYGNSEKNLLSGPAQLNTDLALMKNFLISERYGRLQFRTEFFNAFNQVRLGNPDANLSSPTFGRIFSAADPRLIQVGLKYTF